MKFTPLAYNISRVVVLTTTLIATSHAFASQSVTTGFSASPDREYVEVNLDRGLIELAVGVVRSKQPELAALLNDISRVNVRVIGLDESNRSSALERINEIRTNLGTEGWTSIISVLEGAAGDNVSIMAQIVDNVMTGLVITVIDSEDEVVVVDISGRIRTDQMAELI